MPRVLNLRPHRPDHPGMRTTARTALALAATGALFVAPASTVLATSVPAETSPVAAEVTRLSGPDRVATAVSTSQQLFPEPIDTVVVASSQTYADSIGGATLAGLAAGPLLLTDPTALPDVVDAEVKRLLRGGGTVYLLGGEKAVGPDVAKALKAAGRRVERLSGPDRYATAVAVARVIAGDGPSPVYLASGTTYPDGLSVAPLAAHEGAVVLLTDGATMPPATAAFLASADPGGQETVAVGGAAKAAPGGRSVVGADRYDTSARVAALFDDVAAVGLSTGANWPDALVGAAAMGTLGGPLLLTDGAVLGPAGEVAGAIAARHGGLPGAILFGGEKALGPGVLDQVAALR